MKGSRQERTYDLQVECLIIVKETRVQTMGVIK